MPNGRGDWLSIKVLRADTIYQHTSVLQPGPEVSPLVLGHLTTNKHRWLQKGIAHIARAGLVYKFCSGRIKILKSLAPALNCRWKNRVYRIFEFIWSGLIFLLDFIGIFR
jgi:hypothetical protein